MTLAIASLSYICMSSIVPTYLLTLCEGTKQNT